MKRMKRHKVKREQPEASSSFTKEKEEHDLAYYIHDRVELMHQVFSCLKYKELKAMAPECVRHISIDDLQELCTEELLGISSKRLCAILDGAEPPSDTESSSQSPSPPLETISLDSISSDDEILSQTSESSKRTKKHKHKHSKDRSKKKEKHKSRDSQPDEDTELSRASRAGLTVLELLELQARARAIRAQLQKEQSAKQTSESAAPETHSDDEVEIKEEPREVVEISSEDEKPNVQELEKEAHKAQETTKSQPDQQSVVRRINDLVITIPQSKQTRKIKLNRGKAPDSTSVTSNDTKSVASVTGKNNEKDNADATINIDTNSKRTKIIETGKSNIKECTHTVNKTSIDKMSDKVSTSKNKAKKTKAKKKKKEEKMNIEEDHDEITLQLSDSEKMDLLEDLDRKNYDNVSSSCTEDSESSSETSEDGDSTKGKNADKEETSISKDNEKERRGSESEIKEASKRTEDSIEKEVDTDVTTGSKAVEGAGEIIVKDTDTVCTETANDVTQVPSSTCDEATPSECVQIETEVNLEKDTDTNKSVKSNIAETNQQPNEDNNYLNEGSNLNDTNKNEPNAIKINNNVNEENIEISGCSNNIADTISKHNEKKNITEAKDNGTDISIAESSMKIHCAETKNTSQDVSAKEAMDCTVEDIKHTEKGTNVETNSDKQLSDGELTDNESSEIEVTDLKPEVVCISDEEISKKKKKKKDKKKKKSKKSDFRKGSDHNFFDDKVDNSTKKVLTVEDENNTDKTEQTNNITIIDTDNESVSSADNKLKENNYIIIEDEILILSDDSSCYEVDTYLSKEPTAEEIEALSLRIDEIDRDDIISEKEILEHEKLVREKERIVIDHKEGTDTAASVKETENSEKVQNNTVEKRMEDTNTVELVRDSNITEGDADNISWKARYLDSKKVKKVLSTANIFNALRKKNIELKKKLEEKRRQEELQKIEEEKESVIELVVGSVEHYNTLEGSTKYVNPVTEKEAEVTREMKRDAKQLLKMYKKLLKYNDMNRVKDPSKRKKKKKVKDSIK